MKETITISGALFVLTAIFQTSSANPVGGTVTVGSASITQNGDILSVVTGSTRTVIDWDSFSIGHNQLTQILQPGANAATLNRVVGTMPSELLGSLVSNGKVALINENGILIGNTGIIDTHGFVGSTLNTTNDAFVANGSLVFSGASEATISNQGSILAREGDVFLLGRNVSNSGSIEARNGNAGLAAGGEIVLRKAGDEHVYVEVKSSAKGDKVVNSGTIKAIQADLHANGNNPYQYAMNTGETGVNHIQVRPGGGVYLNAGTEGSVEHSGSIQAVKGNKGGEVTLSGKTVDVKTGSTIDASGPKGGGTVKIGGGFKGKDKSIANSRITRVQEGATIKADATENGKGGEVVVWSDGATSFHGDISARGAGTGAGGDAEVSGKQQLDFQGTADLTSASGVKGNLLLDPDNIIIQSSNPDLNGDGTTGDDLTLPSDLSDAALDFPGATSIITAAKVADLATLSNLTLAATNDITVNAAIDTTSLALPFTSLFSLNLQAGHDIVVNSAITNIGTGSINLTAGNDITVGAAISTLGTASLSFGQTGAGGTLTFASGGSVTAVLGATATGGTGNDTVTFASSPGSAIAIDLAGGSNAVNLTTGNDLVTVTGANALTFGSATLAHVTSVAGNGGSDSIALTAGNGNFSVTGPNAGSGSGMTFTAISSVDGGGAGSLLTNSTAGAFDGAGLAVGGVTVSNFATINTAALNLSTGADTFTVTGAGAGTFSGQAYSGLTSVDGLAGVNEVDLAGNFSITGANAGTGAGIAFTSLDKVSGTGGADVLTNGTADAFDGSAVAVDGVTVTGFETINTAALNLSTGDDTFAVTGAGAGTFGGQAYSGLSSVDGLTGVNEVDITGSFSITGANAGSGQGIAFTNLGKLLGTGAADVLTNSTAGVYDGAANQVGGVTVSGFETISTAALNLTGGDDAFSVTGAGTGTFGAINFTGLSTVNGLAGSNLLINNSGLAYNVTTGSVAGVAGLQFQTVQTPLLNLTTGDDLFTVTGAGTGTFGSQSFTNLTHVDGFGGTDNFFNNTTAVFSAASMSTQGITAVNFAKVGTANLTLTAGDDTFVINGNGGFFNGVNYGGLHQVDALGGNNTLLNQGGSYFEALHNPGQGIVQGIVFSHFQNVDTALVTLTDDPDAFTYNGLGKGTSNGVSYTSLTSVDGMGNGGTVINNSGLAFNASTPTIGASIGGVAFPDFAKVVTPSLNLTSGDDVFTYTGTGAGTFFGVIYSGLTLVDGKGGSNTFINQSSQAFHASDLSVEGVSVLNFGTVNTSLLNLTTGDDVFTLTGSGTGIFGGLTYIGLTHVDALVGTDTFVNNSGSVYAAGIGSAAGVGTSNFETVQSALLALSAGDDTFTVTGANSGTFLGTNFTGVTSVDGLGGSDTLVNSTALAFDAATNSVSGVTQTNFEIVNTALLNLTTGDDSFTVTGAGAGSFGGLSFTGLTTVDALAGNDTLINSTGLAFEASTTSVAGVTGAGFETVNTSLLNLTTGDDSFNLTGAGTGIFGGLNYTGLTHVDALAGNDTFVNNSGLSYSVATDSAAGVSTANFETVQTALLALTGGNDVFTVTGANTGTFGAQTFTGVTNVDGLGGSDTLVNSTALAYDGAANSVSGITQTNFETVSTALINLTLGDDVFTVTGPNTGTFGALNVTNLTQVDGLGGSDTLVNGTALAFEASTLSVSGVTEANFETVNTALLNLTLGDDSFALTGSGTGTFAGLNYTGLTAVDGLAGSNTVVLTGGNDSFTVTGTRAGNGSSVAFVNLDKVDGAGGSDTLVNSTALAFEGSTNSVGGVSETNFETISTDKLNLTTGDDVFTVTGANTGTFGPLNIVNLTQVDGLAGSDTLVNSTAGAYDGALNKVAGITEANFETVSTSLLTLTTGDDTFTVTGAGTGTFGALAFTNLTQVDALSGSDTVVLTAGDDSLTVNGTGAATTSGVAFSNIEAVDGSTGVNSIVLTSGDDLFTATGPRAGNGLGIAFSNIDSVDGAGGTNTYVGTAGADNWSVTGTNAGSLLGTGFSNFSQLRSGGTAVDVFDFASGGDVTGFISGTNAADLNLAALAFTNSGAATNLTGSIHAAGLRLGSTAGGSFTLLNPANDVGTLAANLDGSLTFSNATGYTVGTVDGTTGITTTGDSISLTSGTGSITLASNITTGSTSAGDVTLSRDVVLVSDASVTGGSASFTGAVDGAFALAVNSGGSTTFTGAVGGNTALVSVTTDAGGSTAINGGTVTTSGAQTYGDTVTLGAPASVFTGSTVSFNATLDGASATTVNAVTTLFTGAVGSTTALTSLTTDAAGTTTVNAGAVTTSGAQVYNDAVTLGSATSVFTGAAVDFGSTLNGASDVTVNATTTTFGAAVGGATALTSLTTDAAGGTTIQGPSVTTTGNQSYGDDVLVTNATTVFSGAGVSFGAKLDGSSAVTVNATDTHFEGAVGGITALTSLTTDAAGTTEIDGGSIVTTGNQLYADLVTLGGNTVLQSGGSLDFTSISAASHDLTLDVDGTISLGDVLEATKLDLETGGDVSQKAGSQIVVGELTGNTLGRTVLFNPNNQIVTIGNFTAAHDLLIFDAGTSGGTAVYGMNVTGDINGHGSVWLVEGSGGLKVDPGASVTVDGTGNGLLLVGGLDLALGIPGSGELVLKGHIGLTGGARGFLVMNSIGVDGFGGSDLTGARDLIKSLNFSFDPSLPQVFGDALRGQASVGPLDYNALADVIASKLPNPVLGPLTAAVFQSPKPDTDSASQISDIVALVRGFFNDLDNGEEKVTSDSSAIVEIGKMARFESGVYPPAYGPFALTSYEYEWWVQERDGKVADKDLFYGKRYPLYLKQKGKGPNGRPQYDSILEDR